MLNLNSRCGLRTTTLLQTKYTRCNSFLKTCNSSSTTAELAAAYVPHLVEREEYECDYFRPKITSNKPFSLILPPPNITGALHLGHALTATIQDVIVRWKRMEGIETVWVPGIDHAGIATQVVVEKLLWKEKLQSRHDIGRELFQKRVWKWKEEKASVIESQLRRLGASLDWSRHVFTMDPAQTVAVTKAFVALFDAGLVYRADHPVNWSCSLQSAISDVEVEHLQVEGPTDIPVPGYKHPVRFGTLTLFAYKFQDSDDEVVVATTRPETMVGDAAVAVNPRDGRYSRYVGRYLWHPFRKQPIPIICDDFVDPDFGTGAVKVTPAHDPVDFEVGKRHSLRPLSVIDERGNLTFGDLAGLPRFEARNVVVERLEAAGLLRGRQAHGMTVPICSRSKDVIECLIRPQWFIKCSEMAARAAEDVRRGRLRLEPKQFEKTWFNWLENIRDWCVSRQLWWGHRIPVYSCETEGRGPETALWIAAEGPADARRKAAARLSTSVDNIKVDQDRDVLDTWFSSALLPFTAFGWPQQGQDLDKYYPLDLMETGHDILFFWVARMVMLAGQLTGRIPFSEVLLHGIICDAQGRKMSKSLGNVVTPEDVISGSSLEALEAASRASHEAGILTDDEVERAILGQKKMFPEGIPECGADALRFTLCSHNIKSHFINFDVQECHTNKLFCNKIWQATKYTNGAMEAVSADQLRPLDINQLGLMDRWILSRLTHMVHVCRKGMEKYEFHVVTAAIKNFLYYEFCDVYLETTKRALKGGEGAGHGWTLTRCLDVALRAAAPFMPRLAQHLHRRLRRWPGEEAALEYPQDLAWRDEALEQQIEYVLEIVVAIRRMKKLFGLAYKHKPEVHVVGDVEVFGAYRAPIEDLSKCHKVTISSQIDEASIRNTVSDRIGSKSTLIYLSVPPDLRKSLELDLPKLESKKTKLIKELEKMNKMISGDNYRVKASVEAQQTHAKKIATIQEKLARINYIQTLSK